MTVPSENVVVGSMGSFVILANYPSAETGGDSAFATNLSLLSASGSLRHVTHGCIDFLGATATTIAYADCNEKQQIVLVDGTATSSGRTESATRRRPGSARRSLR